MTSALWFFDHGIHVFPTVNKVPAVPRGTSQFDYRCTRDRAARFREYGVPLSASLGVLDTDQPEAEAWVLRHITKGAIPAAPLCIATARGRHRYYQLAGVLPKYIHRDGHTLEFRNIGQYVVGPGSVRPDGVVYRASDWSWRWDDLPFFPADFLFDDRPPEARGSADGQPLVLPEVIRESERHETLHKIMRSLVARGVPWDAALKACYVENHTKCRPPLEENDKLKAYLRRAYEQKDRADFFRSPQTGWTLVGGLLEVGLSVDAALVAVRSVTPDFDPEVSE